MAVEISKVLVLPVAGVHRCSRSLGTASTAVTVTGSPLTTNATCFSARSETQGRRESWLASFVRFTAMPTGGSRDSLLSGDDTGADPGPSACTRGFGIPNLGGARMPQGWQALLDKYSSSGKPMAVRAEIDILMLLADLRVRHRLAEQAEAEASARAETAKNQADALNKATWVLATATVALVLATVALILVTAFAN